MLRTKSYYDSQELLFNNVKVAMQMNSSEVEQPNWCMAINCS